MGSARLLVGAQGVSKNRNQGLEMKIFLVSMRFDYDSLLRAGHTVEFFDYMDGVHTSGPELMNRQLLEKAAGFTPDVAIVSLYTDQILPETIEKLRSLTRTLCFFHDDMWRREFALFWAPKFDYFTSSDFECVRKYERKGLRHIIHFPFGVNHERYKPLAVEKQYDVSFVGQWHPYREWLIHRLKKAGINVHVAGYRWPTGPVSHDEMVRIFNQSRINLNLSNSSSWDLRYLISSPSALARRFHSPKDVEQLKARHFEICACNAFQLSYYVDGLERCYRIGEEIAVYISPDDLVDKVRYYLEDHELTTKMAHAAYERTIREHTYIRRFHGVFTQMGLLDNEVQS
jgi:spore maturation protein CgeB